MSKSNPFCIKIILGIFLLFSNLGTNQALGASTKGQAKLLSLRVVPQTVVLYGPRASQQLLVLGNYSDGIERDLTRQSNFSLMEKELVTIDQNGKLTALTNGKTSLKITAEQQIVTLNVSIENSTVDEPFNFQRRIGGILTKHGCNDSSCHGGVKGRGGFKLSLNSLHPLEDHQWIVKGGTYQVMSMEPAGPLTPRINLNQPEKSLLLLKPTLEIAHGGGLRFTPDSKGYHSLLKWISAGAPYGDAVPQTKIHRIEIFPQEAHLEIEGTQQIIVTGHLSNGKVQDLTDQASYHSNNQDILTVSQEGYVKGISQGETTVIIQTPGHTSSIRFGVISDDWILNNRSSLSFSAHDYSSLRFNFIDDFIFDKLHRFRISPSKLSSDSEFLRRVCLDLTGTLPPPNRVREFLNSQHPQKREQLINTLLNSPEYVDFWTFRIGQLFRVAASATGSADHAYTYWRWVRQNISKNKSYKEIAFERLAAQGFEGASRHFLPYGEEALPEEIMPEEVRVFLGRRLDCAQCHNHPFEHWTQDQFWGLAAFFGLISRTEWPGFGATVIFDDPSGKEPDFGSPQDSVKVIHPRRKKIVKPTLLDGQPISKADKDDPRRKFALWVTSHPFFAEALVNRMWNYLFGRGLVNPVDDFRSNNPATHPNLLKALAHDFRRHGHDLKQLLRRIVTSRTYQLSSNPSSSLPFNPKKQNYQTSSNKNDTINYSHFIPKPLEAEILLDAISQVTGVPESFKNNSGGQAPLGTRAIHLEVPDIYPSDFLEMYGKPNRNLVPEIRSAPSLTQALHMLVGPTYTEKIANKTSRLGKFIKNQTPHSKVIQELYLIALSRFPSKTELTRLEAAISSRPSKKEAWEDLMWGLISSREFAFNH